MYLNSYCYYHFILIVLISIFVNLIFLFIYVSLLILFIFIARYMIRTMYTLIHTAKWEHIEIRIDFDEYCMEQNAKRNSVL